MRNSCETRPKILIFIAVSLLIEGKPIKIIETEENFKLKPDQTTFDYSQLKTVFQATIYIFNWDPDSNQTIIKGKRNLSEGTCALSEYEGTIEAAKKLLKEQ